VTACAAEAHRQARQANLRGAGLTREGRRRSELLEVGTDRPSPCRARGGGSSNNSPNRSASRSCARSPSSWQRCEPWRRQRRQAATIRGRVWATA